MQRVLVIGATGFVGRAVVAQLAARGGYEVLALTRQSTIIPMPTWVLRAGAALLGRANDMQRLCGNLQVDISKARAVLGWVPPVSVDQGLHRAVSRLQKP